MNNVIYRKIKENLRNRISIQLVNNNKNYLKYRSKPSCISCEIFGNILVAIHKSKLALKLNKPAYIGMYILELSKVLIHKCYYDYLKNKYDNKSKLLFTNMIV